MYTDTHIYHVLEKGQDFWPVLVENDSLIIREEDSL